VKARFGKTKKLPLGLLFGFGQVLSECYARLDYKLLKEGS